MAHRQEFDLLCAGGGVLDAALLDGYYACTKYILSGHEGVPMKPAPRKMRSMPSGPNGETVYDRIHPHPGDGGAGRPGPAQVQYVVEHAGVKIIYQRGNI